MTERVIKKITDFLYSDEDVVFALLFGSYAKGQQRGRSDIDIAIYLKNEPDADTILEHTSRLTEIAKKEVDLVVLNRASAMLRHQVFKNKTTLFVKDMPSYVRFRVKCMNDYEEYKHISGLDRYD